MTTADREALFVQLSHDVEALMRIRKLSIRKLARRADVDHQTVLNILKGRPTQIGTLLNVAHALGASLAITITPHGSSEPN